MNRMPDGLAARTDSGAALVIVLFIGILGVGLGLVMLRVADVETWSAATERDGAEALHAADALLEFSIHELGQMADWTPALSGGAARVFWMPVLDRSRVVAGPVDLVALTRALQADTNVRSTAGPGHAAVGASSRRGPSNGWRGRVGRWPVPT